MKFNKSKDGESLTKSVFIAYAILVMHVLLIAGLGLLVLFFRGVVNYMVWIFLGGSGIIIATGYYFLKRMKEERKTLNEMLSLPAFSGRSVEVKLMGGLASVKMGSPKTSNGSGLPDGETSLLLEDSTAMRVRDLAELGRMLEKGLISREEYEQAKEEIFRPRDNGDTILIE